AGVKLGGRGQLKRQGCVITLTDDRLDRQVQGTFDGCTTADNGQHWVLYAAGANVNIQVTVIDTQPPKTKVYFNPVSRPGLPIVDVSAFATCP
ncbi:MAG: hypothetical protein ACREA9_16680, partial [Pyrinomonadaceae bacterium]